MNWGMSPFMVLQSVDFPHPLAPIMARNSPSATSRFTWRRVGAVAPG